MSFLRRRRGKREGAADPAPPAAVAAAVAATASAASAAHESTGTEGGDAAVTARLHPNQLRALDALAQQALAATASLPSPPSIQRLLDTTADAEALAGSIVRCPFSPDDMLRVSQLLKLGGMREAEHSLGVLVASCRQMTSALLPEELLISWYSFVGSPDTSAAAKAEAVYTSLYRFSVEAEAVVVVHVALLIDTLARLAPDPNAVAAINDAFSAFLGPTPTELASLIASTARSSEARQPSSAPRGRRRLWRRNSSGTDVTEAAAAGGSEATEAAAKQPTSPTAVTGFPPPQQHRQPQPQPQTQAPTQAQAQADSQAQAQQPKSPRQPPLAASNSEEEALKQAIANSLVGAAGEDGTASVLAELQEKQDDVDSTMPTRSLSTPAGMLNLGNTCYISCLLQIYFHLPCLRAEVLSLPPELDTAAAAPAATASAGPAADADDQDVNGLASGNDGGSQAENGTTADASAAKSSERDVRFVRELQLLFARLALSVKQSVSPRALLQELFADSSFVMGAEADAPEVNKLLLDRLEAGLVSAPDAARRVRRLLYGEMAATIRAHEADGSAVTVKSVESFSEIILPIADVGGELYQALGEVMRAEVENYETPGKHFTKAVKTFRLRTLPEILSVQLQRVTYDKAMNCAVKSHAAFGFPLELDVSDYCDEVAESATAAADTEASKLSNGATEATLGRRSPGAGGGVQAGGDVGAGGGACHAGGVPRRTRYQFHAALLHIGNVTSGHYQVLLRSSPRRWHMLSDCYSEQVDEQVVLDYCSGRELDPKKGTPYCLFYAREPAEPEVINGAGVASGPGDSEPAECDPRVPEALRLALQRENDTFLQRKAEREKADAAAAAAAASQRAIEARATVRAMAAADVIDAHAVRLGINSEWVARLLRKAETGDASPTVAALGARVLDEQTTHTLLMLTVKYADGESGGLPLHFIVKAMRVSSSAKRELYCYKLLSPAFSSPPSPLADASADAKQTDTRTTIRGGEGQSPREDGAAAAPATVPAANASADAAPSEAARTAAQRSTDAPIWVDAGDARPEVQLASAPASAGAVAPTAGRSGCSSDVWASSAPDVKEVSPLRVPRFYGADSCFGGKVALLLEHIPDVTLSDQLSGASEAQARASLRSLAVLHAKFWGKTAKGAEFQQLPLSPVLARECATPAQRQKLAQEYAQCWPSFAPAFRAHAQVPAEALRAAEALLRKLVPLLEAFSKEPLTVLHGDCRVTNFLYSSSSRAPVLIDFEYASRGRGAIDVATFMCGSLRCGLRRALEMDLLMEYHSTLIAYGVGDYSFEALVSDYRNSLLLCLVLPILSAPDWLQLLNAGLLKRGSSHGDRFELACSVVHRITTAVGDLHSGDLSL